MSRLPLTLIAAVARNRVIGRDGHLPWRLPSDMAHFRAATMGRPVLVGRRTFESIGGPLKGRELMVVSHRSVATGPGVHSAGSVAEALRRAEDLARAMAAPEIMVAGGSSLYEALLPQAKTLLITEVDLDPVGDAYFPEFDRAVWIETSREPLPRGPEDDARAVVSRLARRVVESPL